MLTDKNFMKIAYEVATGSKCVSRQVGAVIVKNNRILSIGYNGTPSGYINCKDFWKGKYTAEHHDWSYKYEIHAEMNAIVWAARNGIPIEGATIYCTYEPCWDCTRAMLGAGIKKIVFSENYKHHDSDELRKFIEDCGAKIKQIKID